MTKQSHMITCMGSYDLIMCPPVLYIMYIYVTVHDKTNHIAVKMIFELRRPLPKSTFELRLEKFEVSSRCSYGDMSQNVPGSPILNFSSKRNETLLRTLTRVARGSPVYSPFMQIRGPAHKINKLNGR